MSTICPILWKFQSIRNNGDFRVCCQANTTKDKGVFRKDDGSTYNATSDNINDVRNTTLQKDMRLSQLKGEWPAECARCKLEEDSGLPSRRVREVAKYNFTVEEAQSLTSDSGEIDVIASPVVNYDLRFGNKCNLQCIMCGPTDSDSWYDDYYAVVSDKFYDTSGTIQLIATDKKVIADTKVFDWHQSESFWEALESNIHNIEHVYLIGGEPLMIKRHYDFLQKCIDFGVANKIVIEYNTNLTILPQKVLDLWSHFKQVWIGASIDGTGAVIEYMRYPLNWEKTLENLVKVNNGHKNLRPRLAATIAVFNVFHIPEFIKWKITSGLDRINSTSDNKIMTVHVAHIPHHVNIKILPKHLKEQVAVRYRELYQWFDEHPEYEHLRNDAEQILEPIINFMNSGEIDANHEDWLRTYVSRIDKRRNNNIFDIAPEFKGWL